MGKLIKVFWRDIPSHIIFKTKSGQVVDLKSIVVFGNYQFSRIRAVVMGLLFCADALRKHLQLLF